MSKIVRFHGKGGINGIARWGKSRVIIEMESDYDVYGTPRFYVWSEDKFKHPLFVQVWHNLYELTNCGVVVSVDDTPSIITKTNQGFFHLCDGESLTCLGDSVDIPACKFNDIFSVLLEGSLGLFWFSIGFDEDEYETDDKYECDEYIVTQPICPIGAIGIVEFDHLVAMYVEPYDGWIRLVCDST